MRPVAFNQVDSPNPDCELQDVITELWRRFDPWNVFQLLFHVSFRCYFSLFCKSFLLLVFVLRCYSAAFSSASLLVREALVRCFTVQITMVALFHCFILGWLRFTCFQRLVRILMHRFSPRSFVDSPRMIDILLVLAWGLFSSRRLMCSVGRALNAYV